MAPKCQGLCDHEKNRAKRAYLEGYKRCSVCVKFIKTDELRCYCCKVKLRTGAYKAQTKKRKLETIARY